ncbi:MAG: amino acid permease [Flavobacteriales bacterium]|nr:amino acid permease [Flavobacteriales bacterium]
MAGQLENNSLQLGTMPVFLTSIATILGAILFLRFGYSVANISLLGTIALVVIAHMVTVPTALAVSEIATNQKVEGGGLYHIISRSFGLNIGAAIGIALYLSQAISVSFYVVAFTEAFMPYINQWAEMLGYRILYTQAISIPTVLIISGLMLYKGADIGIKLLYLVIVLLSASLFMFFMGTTGYKADFNHLTDHISNSDDFFQVFAICFPAFTGIAAGIGLSGDLKDPKVAIPRGTIIATLVGGIIYIAVAYKLFLSASPEDLGTDMMIMEKIAIWGPIIPIGLAASTLSSALGSVIIAPRTLQAIGNDHIFPSESLNRWLSQGTKKGNEPINGSLVTSVLALLFVAIGSVDFVAEIITMFFMVTYGAICLISFLEHFAADPSYRPTFRSRWYISLLGAVLSVWLMFKINTVYAVASLSIMLMIYFSVTYFSPQKTQMAKVFQGVIFQLSRRLQVFLQKADTGEDSDHWRPSVVCVTSHSFERFAAFDMLRWISHKYGFGTFIHLIEGYLSRKTNQEAKGALSRLIKMAESSHSNVYLDTLISPSATSAIAQVIQLPGISGKDNNMLMFEFSRSETEDLGQIVENYSIIRSVNWDTVILGSTEKGFGYHNQMHIWITPTDFDNANLMILLGYIILGHPEWSDCEISINAIVRQNQLNEQKNYLLDLTTSGRLPISAKNINLIVQEDDRKFKDIVCEKSGEADLIILGFRSEAIKRKGHEVFEGYDGLGNILFVNAVSEKEISML